MLDSKGYQLIIPDCSGSYILAGELTERVSLTHNRWSHIRLPKGYYFYCGSARNSGGLRARVGRHLNKSTSKFWHIDFIKPFLQFRQVWWIENPESLECKICASVLSIPGALTPLRGFGASDCKNHCNYHLVFFKSMESLDLINNTIDKLISSLTILRREKSGSSTICEYKDRSSF